MTHNVDVKWNNGLIFESNTPGGQLMMDAEKAVGGQDKGNHPKPLMLAALAGCTGMDVASLIKKMRLTVDDFKIDVQGELTDEHPKYYKKVQVNYFFTGDKLNVEKLTKAVNLSVDRYCGVFEMFRNFAEIKTEIKFN